MVFRKLKFILSWPTQFKAKISKDPPNLDKETWGLILRSSQAHFPIKKFRSWRISLIQGVQVITPRLTEEDSMHIYGTRYLPIMSSSDPMFAKIVHLAHLNYTAFTNPAHLSIKGTLARVLKGSFGIFTQNLSTLITQLNFGCQTCNMERGVSFTPPPQGERYVGIKTDPHIFQDLSLDLLGPINCLPYPNSRRPNKFYLLAVADKNFGGFETQLIGDASTRSILLGLLNIQNKYNKILSISSDAGTAFINLNPQIISSQSEDIRHLFDQVQFHIANPNSQWKNYVERNFQIFKKMVRSMYKITKHVPWPLHTVF